MTCIQPRMIGVVVYTAVRLVLCGMLGWRGRLWCTTAGREGCVV